MLLAPYIMTEDEKRPYHSLIYVKLEKPICDLFKRTCSLLQNSNLLNEYGYHGFIYRSTRYTGLHEPTRKPLPILVDEICPEFSIIHREYQEILELKDRMFRASRQFEARLPNFKFMDGETYPEHSPHIDFYLKVQEEYHEYMGRYLILRGIQ